MIYLSFISIFFITLAGTPPTMVFGSTSFVTTAPAATTAPSPMVTPARTVALAPIQTDEDGNLDYIPEENYTEEMWNEQKKLGMRMMQR